jgi:hypothetical protein
MIPDGLPDELDIPTEPMGMKKLAEIYGRAPSTLRRRFLEMGINEIIGTRVGRDFTPEQLLIIFALYFPPKKYYNSFWWLEKHGHIETLLVKYKVKEFQERRKQERINKTK